jgi:RNA polymerase sigma-70 factor (ECF subfamily)
VHEVFEVVWAKRHRGPSDSAEWAPWAFGILRNKILQELQRRQRKHHDNRFAADFNLGPGEVPFSADIADTVAASIVARSVWDALSPDDKELLLIVVNTSLLGSEAASLLGISHDAYRRRVSRMRARIADQNAVIGDREGGEVT